MRRRGTESWDTTNLRLYIRSCVSCGPNESCSQNLNLNTRLHPDPDVVTIRISPPVKHVPHLTVGETATRQNTILQLHVFGLAFLPQNRRFSHEHRQFDKRLRS